MFPTPRKSDGAMDTHAVETSTPSSEPRKRGRRQGSANDLLTPLTSLAAATPSPSATRRRGCNCKKSGCLKLYCECFAAGMRCGDRCQCLGCKNREHNKLEIAHAMETIEKRSQRSAKSPVVGGVGVAAARKQGPPPHPRGHGFAYTDTPPTHGLRTPVIDGATRLLLSAERLEETPRSVDPKAPVECICVRGVCHAACPCHVHFGGCSRRCACRQIPTTQEKTRGCSCKKSNCLKLYCECLAAQRQCDSRCNCEGCKNHTAFTYERERAIAAILERNPMAFEPKVATGASQHQRGCNCRKSNCMKNYCECHQAGVPCTGRCACQDCRNTDAFVSAKKMLIFSGDLKVRGPTTSPESSHVHALTPASAKPPRRPSRHASMDQTSPPSHLRTSTGQTPTALELLSRTAPPAPQQDPSFFHHGRTHPHAKRKQADGTLGDESVRDASTDAKRKFTKPHHSTSRLNFQERLDRAASSSTIDLPSVESVLDADVDAARPELPLSKLCRSLLHAASSVDVTPTPRKTESAAATTPTGISTVRDASTEDDFVEARGGGALSPMTDDLLCEEDIETPTRGTSSTTTGDSASRNGSKRSADADDKQRAADLRLAALQERAVLQEFSVWLRNLATL